jgi:hypothetical protein
MKTKSLILPTVLAAIAFAETAKAQVVVSPLDIVDNTYTYTITGAQLALDELGSAGVASGTTGFVGSTDNGGQLESQAGMTVGSVELGFDFSSSGVTPTSYSIQDSNQAVSYGTYDQGTYTGQYSTTSASSGFSNLYSYSDPFNSDNGYGANSEDSTGAPLTGSLSNTSEFFYQAIFQADGSTGANEVSYGGTGFGSLDADKFTIVFDTESTTPEPSAAWLLLVGLGVLAFSVIRRRA